MSTAWGLYVHVPWCRIRCPYCAFHVEPEHAGMPADAFVDKVSTLVQTRRAWGFQGGPHTVYLGGGTPSRLPTPALARLLDGVITDDTIEVTMEANPEDVTAAWCRDVRAAGVSRVSLGVQTLHGRHARGLGRTRTARHATAAARHVDDHFETWSADLMFGLHDQAPAEVEADVDAVLALGAPHVSLYGLTVEDGTGFARAEARGRLALPEEDAWVHMYEGIVRRLEGAGMRRYEVSNVSRPGHESVHNQGYWTDRPYLGVGPSAHGYAPDGTRWVDIPDTAAWLAVDDPVSERERPVGEAAATERLLSGLRGLPGIHRPTLAARTGWAPDPATVQRLVDAGMLQYDDGWMRLASRGFVLVDAVTAALVGSLAHVAGAPPPR